MLVEAPEAPAAAFEIACYKFFKHSFLKKLKVTQLSVN